MPTPIPPDLAALGGVFEDVRHRKLEATQKLLGDTIQLDDDRWQEPTLLPGWTRAHVATHLSRNADGFCRSLTGLLTGRPALMYPSEADRNRDIERGSERNGLMQQIDLDTSAGALSNLLGTVPESRLDEPVELRAGFRIPVRLVPLARLSEVLLHHIDLDVGFGLADIDPVISRWLLEWAASRLGDRVDMPALDIDSQSGFRTSIGGIGEPRRVRGDDNTLLGWLTGRGGAEGIEGADGVALPLLG